MRPPARHVVHGVDFSAAEKDAGSRIWIATGVVSRERLRIVDLRRAADLSDWGPARVPSLAALRRFIAERPTCVFGLDFPFGLPAAVLTAPCWTEFVASFAAACPDAQVLRALCGERRRATDLERRAPLAPANLRLYRQTYFGIRDVLAPLVAEDRVCVLPMQYRRRGRPWLIEVCPASTLRRASLPTSYKGKTERERVARERVLRALDGQGVSVPERLRDRALADAAGDALDALVAAYACHRALARGFALDACRAEHLLEGYIFA